MANIVITDDANFLYVAYNDVVNFAAARKIRKTLWGETTCLSNGDGVEIDVVGDNGINIFYLEVDTVNGVAVTSDADLYNKLNALM